MRNSFYKHWFINETTFAPTGIRAHYPEKSIRSCKELPLKLKIDQKYPKIELFDLLNNTKNCNLYHSFPKNLLYSLLKVFETLKKNLKLLSWNLITSVWKIATTTFAQNTWKFSLLFFKNFPVLFDFFFYKMKVFYFWFHLFHQRWL